MVVVLCFRKKAEIFANAKDRHRRTVARVICEGSDASAALVRTGMASAYTRYLSNPQINALESIARGSRARLWSDPYPIPPWEWGRKK